MPVRIYDIAKKLGIESKEVLAKAKELGIAGARVPSSSLDKITAEYLEQQLGPPRVRRSPPTPTPDPTPPAPPVIPAAPLLEPSAGVPAVVVPSLSPPTVAEPVVADRAAPPGLERPIVEVIAPAPGA